MQTTAAVALPLEDEQAALVAIATLSSPTKPHNTTDFAFFPVPPVLPRESMQAILASLDSSSTTNSAACGASPSAEDLQFLTQGQDQVLQNANLAAKAAFEECSQADARMEVAKRVFDQTYLSGLIALQTQLGQLRYLRQQAMEGMRTTEENRKRDSIWRDSLVNKMIEVEYGKLWYTCKVVVCTGMNLPLFRVRYEEDDTEETLILNEDFTAHQEKKADVFQWRFKTEELSLDRCVKMEKQAQAKALQTEQRANAKAMKIEKDATSRAARLEKDAAARAEQLEREAAQRCGEMESQAKERVAQQERLANEEALALRAELAREREALQLQRAEFEKAQASLLLAATTSTTQAAEATAAAEEEEEASPVRRTYKKRRNPLETDEETDANMRPTNARRIPKPVPLFPGLQAAATMVEKKKKRARQSEPALPTRSSIAPAVAAKVSSSPKKKPKQQQQQLKALGYIPKGRFGFVPPERADAVGWRVRIYWKDDKTFYRGQVESYKHKKHQIIYEDGEEEWVKLGEEKVEWYLPADSEFELYGINVEDALAAQQQRKS